MTDPPAGHHVGGLAGVVGAVIVGWGWVLGTRAISDNSFFTHLATGRLILDTGSVPRVDPFSYTAHGEPWVVQSWLASVVYASIERVAGAGGIVVLNGILAATCGWIVWRLTAGGSLIGRLLVALPAMLVATGGWSPRPFLFAYVLFGLGLVWLLAAPVIAGRPQLACGALAGGVWVNLHGSWLIALAVLGAFSLGALLDGDRDRGAGIGRLAAVFGGGVVLGALAVLGPRAVVFPVSLSVGRRDILSEVAEWQAPRFTSAWTLGFLVLVLLAVVGLRQQPTWTSAILMCGGVAGGLMASRNLVFGSLLLIVVAAPATARIGGIADGRFAFGRIAVALMVILGLVGGVRALDDPYELRPYPVRELAAIGPEDRVVAPEFVGNLREALDGEGVGVYVDDRFDMFPSELLEGYFTLQHAAPGWDQVLVDARPDLILWPTERPLSSVLTASSHWRLVSSSDQWRLFTRRVPTRAGVS